jgi:hypothetical protein
VNRQRIVALSAGTVEFWVVDAETRTVQVTDLAGSRVYVCAETVPLRMFGDASVGVDRIFKLATEVK